MRRVVAGGSGHAPTRVHAGSAEVEAVDRGSIVRPPRDRPHEEELLDVEITVEDVPLRETEGALEVERRHHLHRLDRAGDVRRVPADPVDHALPQELPVIIPGSGAQPVRDVLHEARHDVLPRGGERRVDVRCDHAIHPELLGDVAPFGDVVHALRTLQRRHECRE